MELRDIKNKIQEAEKELEIARKEFDNATGEKVYDSLTRLELAEGDLDRLHELEREAEYSELKIM
ncbi:hypothetical protein [Clostridium ganghwense]|uniref:Uncharacterized protein n=1 Tax=Clostridium ganghwense TaxID=312089 RepID=A0ABT4CVF7_9CLOT|nr:hypothetical protein [Clostridium ganghwense]MCY6372433.1 hypothetical protein [Clostridium ganghwense]